MDTKGPINLSSQNPVYIHTIVDAFSHFVVTVSIKSNNATFLHHWILKLALFTLSLVADQSISILILYKLVRSWVLESLLELPLLLGLTDLLKFILKHPVKRLRMFLQNATNDWARKVHMYAYADNSEPLAALIVSPCERHDFQSYLQSN